MTSPIRAVLFDFDYTLVDATEGNLDCLDTALVAVGLPPAERAAAIAATGLSIRELLRRFHGGVVDEAMQARFLECFVQRADQVMVERTVMYPEVPGVLQVLRDRGLQLGVVSTKYRRRLEGVIARQRIMPWTPKRRSAPACVSSRSRPASAMPPSGSAFRRWR